MRDVPSDSPRIFSKSEYIDALPFTFEVQFSENAPEWYPRISEEAEELIDGNFVDLSAAYSDSNPFAPDVSPILSFSIRLTPEEIRYTGKTAEEDYTNVFPFASLVPDVEQTVRWGSRELLPMFFEGFLQYLFLNNKLTFTGIHGTRLFRRLFMFIRDSGPFRGPNTLRESFKRKYPMYSDESVREATAALDEQASAQFCDYRIGPFVVDSEQMSGITPEAEEFLAHTNPDEYTDAKLYPSDTAVSLLSEQLAQVRTADDIVDFVSHLGEFEPEVIRRVGNSAGFRAMYLEVSDDVTRFLVDTVLEQYGLRQETDDEFEWDGED